MERGGAEHELPGDDGIVAEERQRQRPHAAIGERDGIVHVAVRHQRRDRTERLHVVDEARAPRIVGAEQQGRDERPPPHLRPARVDMVDAAEREPRLALQFACLGADVVKLGEVGERPHRHAFDLRVADHHLAEPVGQCRLGCVEIDGGNEGAADGGAFLPRLGRHLAHDFLHEQVELRRPGRGVGAEHGGVERVALGDEAHRLARHHRMRLQFLRGVGRAGERHQILAGEMVEQVADLADDELERTRRQHVRLDQDPDRRFGDVGRRRRRLDDHRHPREQARPELLQHAPHRKVERVDLHRDAVHRGINMLADETAALADRLHVAVDQDDVVGQLSARLGG